MLTSDKHYNLLGQFLSYEENEVLRIRQLGWFLRKLRQKCFERQVGTWSKKNPVWRSKRNSRVATESLRNDNLQTKKCRTFLLNIIPAIWIRQTARTALLRLELYEHLSGEVWTYLCGTTTFRRTTFSLMECWDSPECHRLYLRHREREGGSKKVKLMEKEGIIEGARKSENIGFR